MMPQTCCDGNSKYVVERSCDKVEVNSANGLLREQHGSNNVQQVILQETYFQ